jgi:transposase
MVEREAAVVKLGEIVMILDLHRQGLSVSAIARQTGIDRKTIRKYIERGLEAPVLDRRSRERRDADAVHEMQLTIQRHRSQVTWKLRQLYIFVVNRGSRGGYICHRRRIPRLSQEYLAAVTTATSRLELAVRQPN